MPARAALPCAPLGAHASRVAGRPRSPEIDVLGKDEQRPMPMRCLSGTADPHQVLLMLKKKTPSSTNHRVISPLLICTSFLQTMHDVSPNHYFWVLIESMEIPIVYHNFTRILELLGRLTVRYARAGKERQQFHAASVALVQAWW
jgi:hypothetical protein